MRISKWTNFLFWPSYFFKAVCRATLAQGPVESLLWITDESRPGNCLDWLQFPSLLGSTSVKQARPGVFPLKSRHTVKPVSVGVCQLISSSIPSAITTPDNETATSFSFSFLFVVIAWSWEVRACRGERSRCNPWDWDLSSERRTRAAHILDTALNVPGMFPFRQPPQLGSTFSELVDYSRKTTAGFEKNSLPPHKHTRTARNPTSLYACFVLSLFPPLKTRRVGLLIMDNECCFDVWNIYIPLCSSLLKCPSSVSRNTLLNENICPQREMFIWRVSDGSALGLWQNFTMFCGFEQTPNHKY